MEVFKNGSYQGIYTLTERINRKQLQLRKYASNTIQGELHKGLGWDSAVVHRGAPSSNGSPLWSGFEDQEPKNQLDQPAQLRELCGAQPRYCVLPAVSGALQPSQRSRLFSVSKPAARR